MKWEIIHALDQVRSVIRAIQTSMVVLLTNLVKNVWFKDVNYSHKRLILDAWLGPECASVDWYIVLKIQIKMCKDERQVKMESF